MNLGIFDNYEVEGQISLFDATMSVCEDGIPKMPEEYKGNIKKNCGYTNTTPREWTKKEIEWVNFLLSKGYTSKQIAQSTDRSVTSVSIKIKRISKKDGSYNADHVEEKYQINEYFIEKLKPKTVLDCYCGTKNFYSEICESTTNDINKSVPAQHHMDALRFLCLKYSQGEKYDLVDLDPYGSAFDCFDLAIKMAKNGLVITFGELGHKRFKRLDFARSHYGINSIEDFTIENLIAHVQQIGIRNKKKLTVYAKKEWHNIGRVWFEISPLKITEQWDKNKKRVCTSCGNVMESGYVIGEYDELFCSDECLDSWYSAKEYDKLCQMGKARWEEFSPERSTE